MCLSICVLYITVCQFVCLCICLRVCLCICLRVCLHACLTVHLYKCVATCNISAPPHNDFYRV
uniref:Uncharacterized protein n=1 Tax=Octopus bimaculoides TaxID=37653 RepID=A0A0L8HZT3_OCTBM